MRSVGHENTYRMYGFGCVYVEGWTGGLGSNDAGILGVAGGVWWVSALV